MIYDKAKNKILVDEATGGMKTSLRIDDLTRILRSCHRLTQNEIVHHIEINSNEDGWITVVIGRE